METTYFFGCCCKVRGGIFIGIVSLIESFLKGGISILVLVRNGFLGIEYQKLFDKEKIHAEIYIFLSLFGAVCSILLIHGSVRKSSGKIIWWICFQGISIFHQIFFSIDVVLIVYHEMNLTSRYMLLILIIISIVFLCYIILEIYFMHYIVELYQEIAENEIENQPRLSRMNSTQTPIPPSRTQSDLFNDLTDRQNPMQSSILKLLNELEGNDTSDTAPLIR
ncbi:hypothetical protein PVAND_008357 [Polypedilum vanderplanki]|uniref:Transmembrane protein n=1 Tax=Polypedilum vanderplanki TaxID=319348 RepID=A0A9J6C9Y3_POLVA|nr:hypothetical protein PVAND_008357 [Polypedilum vanderplanki]